MHADASQPLKLECPRCGHAIAPAPAEELASVPAAVTCPECGLRSDLRLLAEHAALPRWFMESRTSDRGASRRFISTFVRALWPLGFWRTLRMDHRFSPRAIAGFLVGILLAIHLCIAAATTSAVLAEARVVPVLGPRSTGFLPPSSRPAELLVADLALAAVFPYCPARGGDVMLAAAQGSPDRTIDADTLSRFIAGVARVTVVRLPIGLPEVPMRTGASGAYTGPASAASGPANIIYPSEDLLEILRGLAITTAIAASPIALVLLLLLLPASFRRLRIRRTHLMRAAAYALAWIPVALALVTTQLVVGYAEAAAGQSMAATSPLRMALVMMLPIGTLAFSILWMFAFTKRYLQLPRAGLVTALLHVMVGLGITVFVIVTLPLQ